MTHNKYHVMLQPAKRAVLCSLNNNITSVYCPTLATLLGILFVITTFKYSNARTTNDITVKRNNSELLWHVGFYYAEFVMPYLSNRKLNFIYTYTYLLNWCAFSTIVYLIILFVLDVKYLLCLRRLLRKAPVTM